MDSAGAQSLADAAALSPKIQRDIRKGNPALAPLNSSFAELTVAKVFFSHDSQQKFLVLQLYPW